jgi:hypothetical protein
VILYLFTSLLNTSLWCGAGRGGEDACAVAHRSWAPWYSRAWLWLTRWITRSSAKRSNWTAGNSRAIQASNSQCRNRLTIGSERGLPCGVPFSLGTRLPSLISIGAFNQRSTYIRTHFWSVWSAKAFNVKSQGTGSKKLRVRASAGQSARKVGRRGRKGSGRGARQTRGARRDLHRCCGPSRAPPGEGGDAQAGAAEVLGPAPLSDPCSLSTRALFARLTQDPSRRVQCPPSRP